MRQLLGTATIVLNSQFLMDQDKNQSELKYIQFYVLGRKLLIKRNETLHDMGDFTPDKCPLKRFQLQIFLNEN